MSAEIIKLLTALEGVSSAFVVVGGAVRDFLMQNPAWCIDIDLMVDEPVDPLVDECQKTLGGTITRHARFGTAKLRFPDQSAGVTEIDFAQARSETYPHPGALPEVTFASIEKDLHRRDFTINAMAVPIKDFIIAIQQGTLDEKTLIDATGGLEDLKLKRIRIIHQKSFLDDPTRLFRAVRYACRYGFSFEPATDTAIGEAVRQKYLLNISDYRAAQEIKKIFDEEKFISMLSVLIDRKLFHPFYASYLEKAFEETKSFKKEERFYKFLAVGCKTNGDNEKFLAPLSLSKTQKKEVYKWL